MPEVLQDQPLIIVIIVLVLVLLIAIPVLIRRRRAGADDVLPPPELGQPIDYTSQAYEEPQGPLERFKNLPIASKLLLALVPLVLIVAIIIAVLAFQPTVEEVAAPVTPPPTLTIADSRVSGDNKILVTATTDLPSNTQVTATLKDGDQDFDWAEPASTSAQVIGGRVRITLVRRADAPKPLEDQEYQVVLSASTDQHTVVSDPAVIEVPAPLASAFYQTAAAAPTPEPTAEPKPTSAPQATAVPQPTATPEPTAAPQPELTATVFNGGNIRERPVVTPCTCPQLHAGQTVQLLEKTADGNWYRVIAPEGTGWVSASLLRIDGEVARQVPVEGQTPPTPVAEQPAATPNSTVPEDALTATVFNGGNIRERPVTGRPLGQAHAGEVVVLLEKTADGVWFRIIAGEATGWVHVTLLTIEPDVASQVPIAP